MDDESAAPASFDGQRRSPLVAAALLTDAVQRLRSGNAPLADYVEQVERRVRSIDPHIRALLPESDRRERLLRDAARLQERYPGSADRPPLFGVAVAVKDLFRVDGFPTRAGSTLPESLFAGPEASVVSTLRACGALILGKTAMDEFAYGAPPATRNPHNLAHTPGGSSGGSAAAVAAGFCPLALGTQTSRSVIGPAAFCGVVGFKPSFGRIPVDGIVPLSQSFDTVGLLTQDVASVTLAAGALVPAWTPAVSTQRPILGIPEGRLLTWTVEEGRAAFDVQVARLVRAGFEVRPVPFFADAELDQMDHRSMTLLHGEMARVHARWFDDYRTLYRPRTARAVLRGRGIAEDELIEARAYQPRFRAQVSALMDRHGIDLWITPASAGPAPVGLEVTGWGGMTTAWSYAGLPCVTVPAGRTATGLPLGLQCIARWGQDEELLAAVRWIEPVFSAGEPAPDLTARERPGR